MLVSRRILVLVLAVSLLWVVPSRAVLAQDLVGDLGSANGVTRRALLRAICQGDVQGPTCGQCPTFVENPDDGDIEVGPFHLGSFVNPGSAEAYVGLSGCEGKPAGFTGAVLLRKAKGTWSVVRYDSGSDVRTCLRFPYKTGTTLLTCFLSGNGAGGVYAEGVGAHYVGPAKSTVVPMIVVQDTSGACFENKDVVSLIGWTQRNVNADRRPDLILTITESHSKATPNDLCQSQKPSKVVTHRIAFIFDGVRFAPAPGAAATVACLNNNEVGGETRSDYCPPVQR
jgi:hypothetical protein